MLNRAQPEPRAFSILPEQAPAGVEIADEGRDLVLLQSLLSDRTSYKPLEVQIAGKRGLIMVNLPGSGRSPPAGPALLQLCRGHRHSV
jgi:hypothetical protein